MFHVIFCILLLHVGIYMYMGDVADQLSRSAKGWLICLLSITCNYVVFVRRGFLFLLVLGIACVILLFHIIIRL